MLGGAAGAAAGAFLGEAGRVAMQGLYHARAPEVGDERVLGEAEAGEREEDQGEACPVRVSCVWCVHRACVV